jgi:CheY-like chemotaxis protein
MSASVMTGVRDGANGRGTDARDQTHTCQRILVVDDDAGSRIALDALLRGNGFETSHAADGEAALADATRELPDLRVTLPLPDHVRREPNAATTPRAAPRKIR